MNNPGSATGGCTKALPPPAGARVRQQSHTGNYHVPVGITRALRRRLKVLQMRLGRAGTRLVGQLEAEHRRLGRELELMLTVRNEHGMLIAGHGPEAHLVSIGPGGKTAVEWAAGVGRNIHRILQQSDIAPTHASLLTSLVRLQDARYRFTRKNRLAEGFSGSLDTIKAAFKKMRAEHWVDGDLSDKWSVTAGYDLVTQGSIRKLFGRFSAAFNTLTQTEQEYLASLMKKLTRPNSKLISEIPLDVSVFADMGRTASSRRPGINTPTLNATQAGGLARLWRQARQPVPPGAMPASPAGLRLRQFVEETGLQHVTVSQMVEEELLNTKTVDDAVFVTLGPKGQPLAEQLVSAPTECDVVPFVKQFLALGPDDGDRLARLLDKLVSRM